MTGSIDEIPLPDLLQLFGSSKKSGVLVIRSDDDVGKIYLRKGVVAFAIDQRSRRRAAAQEHLPHPHVDARLVRPRPRPTTGPCPTRSTPRCRSCSWRGCARSTSSTPSATACPTWARSSSCRARFEPKLSLLPPLELEVFQLAYNHEQLATILNKSLATDLETAKAVLHLLDAGYLGVMG